MKHQNSLFWGSQNLFSAYTTASHSQDSEHRSENMADFDRRTVLTAAGMSTLAASAAGASPALPTTPASSRRIAYTPKPLPYAPGSIAGLSERLLASHHANNYSGAVNRIGAIQTQIEHLDLTIAPGFQLSGLKREELIAVNSMIIHEIYFGGLGKANTPGAALGGQIEQDFGSYAAWRTEFMAMGKALGGGSGWVFLMYSPRAGRLLNQIAYDHTMTMADGQLIMVLDMYEHAYHMDYGARAGAYVDAIVMGALDWTQADRLFGQAKRAQ
jgi:superoxide dismutase, Fe-Mn family